METQARLNMDAPLRWLAGGFPFETKVSLIPKTGMVYFYDDLGPVHRQADIDRARWWVFRKGEKSVRITRLESAGVFTYLVPGVVPAITCDHGCDEPGQCAVVASLALALVKE